MPTIQMIHLVIVVGILGINVWFMPDLPWYNHEL